MVFKNGKGRGKKRDWRWGKEEIEEVKEIKYLGYIHIAEEWRTREAYKREIEKIHDCNEEYMKYRRKVIQR